MIGFFVLVVILSRRWHGLIGLMRLVGDVTYVVWLLGYDKLELEEEIYECL